MKIILTTVFLISMISDLSAQSDRFHGAMKMNLAAIDTSFRSPANMLAVADNFERIAQAEKNQWLPYYYAAYALVNAGFINPDKSKTDQFADRAELLINKADSLKPLNSEISCVKSMIASVRLMVNPMERFMQYGPISASELEKSIAQDPSNPRPYMLKGQALKFTPEQFGGGCTKAIEQLKIARDKFVNFIAESDIAPNWGKQYNQQLLAECN